MLCSLACHVSGVDVAALAGPDTYVGEIADSGIFSDQSRHVALFYHGHGEYLAALSGVILASRARGDTVLRITNRAPSANIRASP